MGEERGRKTERVLWEILSDRPEEFSAAGEDYSDKDDPHFCNCSEVIDF
jgi:hypothetical protein